MLAINMDDVIKVVSSIKGYLIALAAVILLAVAVMVGCRKMKKSKKYLIRWQAGLGLVAAAAIIVNLDPDRPHVLHGLSGYGRW